MMYRYISVQKVLGHLGRSHAGEYGGKKKSIFIWGARKGTWGDIGIHRGDKGHSNNLDQGVGQARKSITIVAVLQYHCVKLFVEFQAPPVTQLIQEIIK